MDVEFKDMEYSINISFRLYSSINDNSVNNYFLLFNICDGLVVPVFLNTETLGFSFFLTSNNSNFIFNYT